MKSSRFLLSLWACCHVNTECTFEAVQRGAAGYGEWIKAPPVREIVEVVRPLSFGWGEQRQAGLVSSQTRLSVPNRDEASSTQQEETINMPRGQEQMVTTEARGTKKWRRVQRSMMPNDQAQWVGQYGGNQVEGESVVGGVPADLSMVAQQQVGDSDAMAFQLDVTE